MQLERGAREFNFGFPDENIQAAEAIEVVRHAVWKAGRGGRQGKRGRNPSMNYSGSRSRNPRECLKSACSDLGFESFEEAKRWLQGQPADWTGRLSLQSLGIRPRPRNIEGVDFTMSHPAVQLDYPIRVQKFLTHLNEGDLADVRPIVLGISDARGRRSRVIMKIMSDPFPENQHSVTLDGRLMMRKGQAVHCLDGQTHAIFPGHMARVHIDPVQDLRHIEFLDVPPSHEE